MAGEPLASFDFAIGKLDHVGVEEAVFPFARFPGVDTVLGPEMPSTGEVMGIDRSFEVAFAKSQLGAGSRPPTSGAVFVSVRDADKEKIVEPLRTLQALGFSPGYRRDCSAFSSPMASRRKRSTRSPKGPCTLRTPSATGRCNSCSTPPRARPRLPIPSLCAGPPSCKETPYYTTISGAIAAAEGIRAVAAGELEVRALQDYLA